MIKVHIGKIPGKEIHKGCPKGIPYYGNPALVRRPGCTCMDNILITVHILHRGLKVFVIPAYKGNLVIAVFLRQVEQICQVSGGSFDIIHLHILYGYRRASQCLYEHLPCRISSRAVPVRIRLIIPHIIPVRVKVLPGVQNRHIRVLPYVILQLSGPVSIPEPLICIRHIFPVDSLLVGSNHHEEGYALALIISGRLYDLAANPGSVVLIKGLGSQGVIQAHAPCKKVPAILSHNHVLGIRIAEQL